MTPPQTPLNEDTSPLLLTAAQVAGLLQIGERTVWRLLSAGAIVAPVRIGGATRWRRGSLERWIDAGCPRPGETTGGEPTV
ncbi:Helix-turn-helix domain protein [Botrimarina colliarenosi]|uniref:Helix-turn-helix domain protein n=1 Tax=Botrimarina colliarenosi TaxID=2528001 RepID=A0A5C6ACM2_9BACT|nr:helix-turn-helix domain-containing protein [Botrimarina colliarenosi]TWT96905.1 Helix-turn-helix domain protein [Botrimarina colliarenosi]